MPLSRILEEVERKLANQETLKETVEELRKQTTVVKVRIFESNTFKYLIYAVYNLVLKCNLLYYSKSAMILKIIAKLSELAWTKSVIW
jgi:uncharacterized protein YfkK (UPF0435 family)